MNDSFKGLFDTDELKSIYLTLPPKLIFKNIETIKSKLKETVEASIDRVTYKKIYKSTVLIKNKLSRLKKSDDIMIPVDKMEECLPSTQTLTKDSKQNEKFKFIKKFTETLKSKVDKNEFKKHDQYERIAGWLVGRVPSLKMSGD
jgi:hypothetical protein